MNQTANPSQLKPAALTAPQRARSPPAAGRRHPRPAQQRQVRRSSFQQLHNRHSSENSDERAAFLPAGSGCYFPKVTTLGAPHADQVRCHARDTRFPGAGGGPRARAARGAQAPAGGGRRARRPARAPFPTQRLGFGKRHTNSSPAGMLRAVGESSGVSRGFRLLRGPTPRGTPQGGINRNLEKARGAEPTPAIQKGDPGPTMLGRREPDKVTAHREPDGNWAEGSLPGSQAPEGGVAGWGFCGGGGTSAPRGGRGPTRGAARPGASPHIRPPAHR